MSRKLFSSALATTTIAAALFACAVPSSDDASASANALVTYDDEYAPACLLNAQDDGLLVAEEGTPIGAEAPEPDPEPEIATSSIHFLGWKDDTGCTSITISDPRKPPKHPPLPTPLPKDWNKRCPAYGPPTGAKIDVDGCTVKSPTLMECSHKVGSKNITFECRRDTPGGKGKAGGVACNFHCYIKEGQR
ncbi:MAG: hypothetical protein KC657_33710 [Myxococcales bacterium]|nr:hypothetical protein [Myxococcales bacterium]